MSRVCNIFHLVGMKALLALVVMMLCNSIYASSQAAVLGNEATCYTLVNRNSFTPLRINISEHLSVSTLYKYGGPKSQGHPVTPLVDSDPLNWTYASSEGQDQIVLKLLQNKTNGFFVDLAARFWLHKSNSFTLEHYYNWSGACIEPDVEFYPSLAAKRKCTVFCNNIIGAANGQKFRFQYKKPLIQLDKSAQGPDVKVSVTLHKILEYMHAPNQIDYLSLDCEGCEASAVRSLNFSKYSIQVISIERPSQMLHRTLFAHGFWFLTHLPGGFGETIYIHNEIVDFNSHMNEYRPDANPRWHGIRQSFLMSPKWNTDTEIESTSPSIFKNLNRPTKPHPRHAVSVAGNNGLPAKIVSVKGRVRKRGIRERGKHNQTSY